MRASSSFAQRRAGIQSEPTAPRHIGAQTVAEEEQFGMHKLPPKGLTLQWLSEHYIFEGLLASGSFGVIIQARGLKTPVEVVLKFQLEEAEDLAREGRIHRLLTDLWVDNGQDTAVHAPIIKVYDYTEHPSKVNAAQFKRLVSSGFTRDAATMASFERMLARTAPNVKWNDPFAEVEVAILVEEKIDTTLFTLLATPGDVLHFGRPEAPSFLGVYTDPTLLRDILTQVLLTLHMLQKMVQFVHGDLHTANVFVSVLPQSIVFRYAVARNTVVYLNTRILIKLGDLGYASLRVPQPVGRRYNLNTVLAAAEHSGYNFQNADPTAFNPSQDLQRLAGAIVKNIVPQKWAYVLSLKIHHVLAAMLDAKVAVELVIPESSLVTIKDAKKRAKRIQQRQKTFNARVMAFRNVVKALETMTESNTRQPDFLRALSANSDQFVHTVFTVDQRVYFPTPRAVFERALDVFAPVFSTMPPDNLPVVDMTLTIGDSSPATSESWQTNAPLPPQPGFQFGPGGAGSAPLSSAGPALSARRKVPIVDRAGAAPLAKRGGAANDDYPSPMRKRAPMPPFTAIDPFQGRAAPTPWPSPEESSAMDTSSVMPGINAFGY